MKLSGSGVFAIAAIVAVGIVGYALWKQKGSIAGAAAAAVDAVNPLSDQNLANKGASAVVQAVTGVKDDTLGGAMWRLFNGDQEAADNAITAPTGPNVPSAQSLDLGTFYPDLGTQAKTLDLAGWGIRPSRFYH